MASAISLQLTTAIYSGGSGSENVSHIIDSVDELISLSNTLPD